MQSYCTISGSGDGAQIAIDSVVHREQSPRLERSEDAMEVAVGCEADFPGRLSPLVRVAFDHVFTLHGHQLHMLTGSQPCSGAYS